jgi:hypothetical protein
MTVLGRPLAPGTAWRLLAWLVLLLLDGGLAFGLNSALVGQVAALDQSSAAVHASPGEASGGSCDMYVGVDLRIPGYACSARSVHMQDDP